MVIVMDYEDNINYEDIDELELPDHIEWNNEQPEEFCLDALAYESMVIIWVLTKTIFENITVAAVAGL